MTDKKHINPQLRHDFILMFDVKDGNPNGDPDAGNLPRLDPETMQGLVTDVCLKRKVRNYVDTVKGTTARYKIYVENRGILARQQKRAFEALNLDPSTSAVEEARKWMCENFFDVRAFGAVMTMGKSGKKEKGKELHWNCGQVRGPIQMTFARSVDMVVPMEVSITRVALTNPDDTGRGSAEDEQASSGQIGRKSIVPYGLYVGYGFINPAYAEDTGLNSDDLELFWQALQNMFEIDRSASRGLMTCRGLYVFTHDNGLGNAPAQKLFERLTVKLKDGIASPRNFSDYNVKIEDDDLPKGVTLTKLMG